MIMLCLWVCVAMALACSDNPRATISESNFKPADRLFVPKAASTDHSMAPPEAHQYHRLQNRAIS